MPNVAELVKRSENWRNQNAVVGHGEKFDMDMQNILKHSDGGIVCSRGLISTSAKVSPHRSKQFSRDQSKYHSPARYASKNASTLGRESPTGSSVSAAGNERLDMRNLKQLN